MARNPLDDAIDTVEANHPLVGRLVFIRQAGKTFQGKTGTISGVMQIGQLLIYMVEVEGFTIPVSELRGDLVAPEPPPKKRRGTRGNK